MLLLIHLALGAEPLDGAQVYQDNCTRCHNPRSPSELDDESWRAVALHMRVKANLSSRELEALEAFLVPPEVVEVGIPGLPESCTTCHDTERIQAAIDSGRDEATWTATLERMRLYGAPLTSDDAAQIAAFLAEQSQN